MNVCLTDYKPSLAVDVDGVLTDFHNCCRCNHMDLENRRYDLCPPKKNIVSNLRRLRTKYRIILHTARGEHKRQVTEKWLRRHRIPYDELVMDKPYAQYYIDDRAVRFESWPQALELLI